MFLEETIWTHVQSGKWVDNDCFAIKEVVRLHSLNKEGLLFNMALLLLGKAVYKEVHIEVHNRGCSYKKHAHPEMFYSLRAKFNDGSTLFDR